MKFEASQVPLEVDVWNEIEKELVTGLVDVLDLRFHYSVRNRIARLKIRHPKDSRIETKHIELEQEDAEKLVIRLAERFNFSWGNINELSFELEPGVVPHFNLIVYPYVSDESTLDKTKNRMDSITID